MDKKRIQLEGFGFGLAIIIPFLVMMHSMPHRLSFFWFMVCFAVILWIVSSIDRVKPLYFIALGSIYFVAIKGGIHGRSIVFVLLALIILGITLKDVRRIEPLYDLWMKLVHPIGVLMSAIFFAIIFYCVFGIVGIILRMLKKDLLEQKLDPEAKTYWKTRELKEFSKENYTKQF